MLVELAMGIVGNAAYDAGKTALGFAFRHVATKRPDLNDAASKAVAAGDMSLAADVFEKAIGVIVADAASGELTVDGGALNALKGIKFDHQHGQVSIKNARVSADVLITGGSTGASGQTNIGGNTVLKSAGTSIEIGHGASIKITGGASIKQT